MATTALLVHRVGMFLGASAVLLASAAALPSPAHAFDRVYWGSGDNSNQVSFANLDGSGGDDLLTGGAHTGEAEGVAIDAVAGRVYWANLNSQAISFANLDGSGGGGDLVTTGATLNFPSGVAIDPVVGRIYWANFVGQKISFARLDGSGGGDLATGAATVDDPNGVAIDPAAGRIYWANANFNTNTDSISFANLNGSGGANLATGTATVKDPAGVAIDPVAGRIYWANTGAAKVSFANLDGSGGGDLGTGSATVSGLDGVAIDPVARKVYWANATQGKISFANLDGSGGTDLATPGASQNSPGFPALLTRPSGSGPPVVSGGSTPGSTLRCSDGSWAPDALASFYYRAPQAFAYQWSQDGSEIPGAVAALLVPTVPGEYRCAVTASNTAGSAQQTSVPRTISSGAGPLIVGGCLNADAKASGKKVGPARVGRRRTAQRAIFKGARLRSRKGIDRYCAVGGGAFRVGYPTKRLLQAAGRKLKRRINGRVVLILTSSTRFTVKGVKPGDSARKVHGKRLRVGRNTWFLPKGRSGARPLIVVRGGKVRAVGIGDSRLTKSHTLTRHFLTAWKLGV